MNSILKKFVTCCKLVPEKINVNKFKVQFPLRHQYLRLIHGQTNDLNENTNKRLKSLIFHRQFELKRQIRQNEIFVTFDPFRFGSSRTNW